VHPKALRPEAEYVFENPETGEVRRVRGSKAVLEGIACSLKPRQGAVWFYRAVVKARGSDRTIG